MRRRCSLVSWILVLGSLGCGGDADPGLAAPALHEHSAPHGGALVELGEHALHLELLLDPDTGRLTVWILDGEAELGVRVAQPTIEIRIQAPSGSFTEKLSAVESALTGETVGDSSEFQVESERLKGLQKFSGALARLEARGQTFTDVELKYPLE